MSKDKLGYFSYAFWIGVALIAAAIAALFFAGRELLDVLPAAILFAAAAVWFLVYYWSWQKREYLAYKILAQNAEKLDKYTDTSSIPTAVATAKGLILWHNPAFFTLAGRRAEGGSIYRLFEQLNKPEKDRKIRIGDKVYVRDDIRTELDGGEYIIFRLIDAAGVHEAVDQYKNVLATICHVQVDNYGDLLRGAQLNLQAEISAEIERVIARNAQNMRAGYQKYDRDKYLFIFERRYLSGLLQNKFAMLEEVRKIDTGNPTLHPTLSMGVGVGTSPADANASALKALEMALSRGGDQAVVKDENGFRFYGGIQQGREKRTRVKTRMFAGALRNLMEQCEKIIIMGHAVPDLDCMGAALGLLACARCINKKVYIVLDKPNVTILRLVDEMRRNPDYKDVLITPAEAENMIAPKDMLIVADTQIAEFTVAPQLFGRTATIVVVDHHVRGTDHIENPTLMLHEPYASSAAEMITETVQYFSENVVLKPLELDALFAGIMIDTKGFSFKSGVRTFEAASYLKRMGADMARVRHLFQDDMQTFTARAKVVESAQILDHGIAISICPKEIQNPQLLAAQAADSLLGISGIFASFVLCEQDGMVLISGRSLGDVNVQRILEKMGGGGHATIAGAQIKGRGMADVVEELKIRIGEYKEEV